MKAGLVEPSKFVSLTNRVSTISMPPLGLAYTAAALQEAGHEVTVVDGPGAARQEKCPGFTAIAL